MFLLISEDMHNETLSQVMVAALSLEEAGEMAEQQLGAALSAAQAGRYRLATALIAHSRGLAGFASSRVAVRVAPATAALLSAPYREAEASAAAREAMHLALVNQFRREEALARRAMGQSPRTMGDPLAAEALLRAACSLLERIGSAFELGRTQEALAAAIEMGAGGDHAVAGTSPIVVRNEVAV